MGVYKQIKLDITFGLILLLIFSMAADTMQLFLDSTDKDGFNRSGFKLLTDYGTGKEYLYRDGVIIPRETKKDY